MSAGLLALGAGALLGFVLSMPALGPLLALIVLSGARGEPRRGLAFAVGGALAESGWAFLAFFGVARLLERHAAAVLLLRAASAALLIAIAVVLWRSAREPHTAREPSTRAAPVIVGFLLVALNPGFPLTWGAVAAALSGSEVFGAAAKLALPLAIGVFVGVLAWFSFVVFAARRLGRRVSESAAAKGARMIAVLLVFLAAWLAISALLGYPNGGWR